MRGTAQVQKIKCIFELAACKILGILAGQAHERAGRLAVAQDAKRGSCGQRDSA